MNDSPRILTNMTFWQSPLWSSRVDSIYPMTDRTADPSPMSPVMEAVKLYRTAKEYDVVLTMGARTSLAYGLLCALTFRRSQQIMTEVFIDAKRPNHPLWSLKVCAYQLVAKRCMGILANSSHEIDSIAKRFNFPQERILYTPLHTTIHEPHIEPEDEGFVLSAGRTLRDYATMLKAARWIDAPVHIVCGQDDIRGSSPSSNVTIHREIGREVYLSLMRRCSVVALPLQETERATGQVVLLEAMGLGKPVVTTASPGTLDHVEDGINGYLIDPGDEDALAERINTLLTSGELRRKLAERALQDVKDKYSYDTHAKQRLAAIESLYKGGR